MTKRIKLAKALFVAAACGGIPLVTDVVCDPYTGYVDFFRDDDDYDDYYYEDYYYDDYYYYEPYCDPFYCY